MLVIRRRAGEAILIAGGIEIEVLEREVRDVNGHRRYFEC